jgi:selenocysteine-specific elongation factor
LLRSLTESAELVRIENFYLTSAGATEARARVREHIQEHGPVTVAQIRDLLGTTRKYAVPLCEWLDGTGATLRRGDVRLLGPRP